ncbi:hypothetical protein FB567DRAFT_592037 [Paraphoma chrysanthemicola]|uniref:F-box domain-containing protein n=1 Tax=Paraphoma chrysanthemicola TaxID=798071 RepID=A0A8K0R8H7_9PLEO|nr:hypothetical protein FB567DRAFT_592037 [Paraphoma chrysanthemicola]
MANQLDSSMSTGFPFLNLPPELRNAVYEQITAKIQRKMIKATVSRNHLSDGIHSYVITSVRTTLPVAILATCRLIHNELKAKFERVMKILELDSVRIITAYEGIVTSHSMKPKDAIAVLLNPCRSFLKHNRSRQDPPLHISIASLPGNNTAEAYTVCFLKAIFSKVAETGARADIFFHAPRGVQSFVRRWVTVILLEAHMKIQAGDTTAQRLDNMIDLSEFEDDNEWAELWKLDTRV